MTRSFSFDSAYYDRFYRDRNRRVTSGPETDRLVGFVVAYMRHLDLPLRTVADVGCGLGLWRTALRKHRRGVRYTGVEVSDYLCERYGWQQGSVVDWDPKSSFDLVVCHGVLQYLGARDARRAIRNLTRLSHGAVYLEALTREDWQQNCDREVTDGDVFLRPVAWYRRALAPHFTNCGGGLFLTHRASAVLYELEKAE